MDKETWLNGDETTPKPKPRGAWQLFKDSFIESGLHNPFGAEGALRYLGIGRPEGMSDEQLSKAERFLSDKYQKAREQDDAAFADDDALSPRTIGRKAVELAGGILGGVDPTYVLSPGRSALQRMGAQGAINSGMDVAAQGVEVLRGVRDKYNPDQTAMAGAGGVALQGAGEAVSKVLARGSKNPTLDDAVGIGNKFGTVTSTVRSPARNKKVGGVKNSYHLTGQAIDIARGKGVSHKQIERAYRRAGFDIIESLDEGDHSHLAFRFNKSGKKGGTGRPIMEDFDFRRPEVRNDNVSTDVKEIDDLVNEAQAEGSTVLGQKTGEFDNLDDNQYIDMLERITDEVEAGKTHGEFEGADYRFVEQYADEIFDNIEMRKWLRDPANAEEIAKNTGENVVPFPKESTADGRAHTARLGIVEDAINRLKTTEKLIEDSQSPLVKSGSPITKGEAGQMIEELEDVAVRYWAGGDHEAYNRVKDALDIATRIHLKLGGTPPPSKLKGLGKGSVATTPVNDIQPVNKMLPRNRDELFARAREEAEASRKANPPRPEDPDAPSAEIRKAKPGVNARRMAQMLGPQLYGDPSSMGSVSIKEVLQNAFDAIKTSMARGDIEKGKIDIQTDPETRTITMRDNGVGMSPDILGGKFLEIAGTGKEEGEASGGFGIAKMLFLYGNDELHVVTVRDGTVSELKTKGSQLFDALEDPAHAPNIDVRPLTDRDLDFVPEGHGTYIRMKLPKDFENPRTHEREEIEFPKYEWDVPGLRQSPLFANIDVRFNDYRVDDVGSAFPAHKYKQFTRVDFGWGDADVYVTREPTGGKYGENVHILSNGLWQFSQKMGKNPMDPWSDNLPYTFYIDVHPNVKPDQTGYPFNFNRQQFTPEAKRDFQQVTNYINQLYAMADFSDNAKSFGKIQYIDENGRFSDIEDISPEIPETNTFTGEGIREGDEVTVQDGRLYVNGQQLPAMTPEMLKESVPHLNDLKIPQEKIDTNRVMVHNNVTIKAWDSFDDDGQGGIKDRYSGYFDEDMDLLTHMREMWPGQFDEYLDVVGNEFKYLRDAVAKFPGYDKLKEEAVGLSFDPEYRGVSIRIPFSGSFLNPLVPESNNIREAALGMIGTMIHELAHFTVRSHNADFPAEMQRLTYKLLADEKFDWFQWQKDFITKVSKYEGVLNYGKKLFEDGRTKVTDSRFKDGAGETRGHEGDDIRDGGHGGEGLGSEPLRDDATGGGGSSGGGGGSGTGGGHSSPYDGLSPEDKLLKALKAAKPLSSEQRKLYHEERSARGSRISHLQSQLGGLAGYHQELGALKGELPKVDYQSIAEHFTQDDFDALLNKIKANTSLLPYEKINTQTALMKLLGAEGAKVPTKSELRLMSEVFDPKMIDALMLQNLTVRQRIWEGMKNALNLPRSLMASFDLSAPFRQGVFMIGRKQFWTNFVTMFKAFGSDAAAKAVQENITTRPTWPLMKKAGLGITTNNSHFLDAREEQFMSSWAEKIPLIGKGVQMSERAYRSFLNKLRADVFDELIEKGQDLGINYRTNKKALKDVARFINAATGRGDLTALLGQGGNAAAPALAGLFFSPRLMASRIQMLNPGFYATLDPMVRKEAIKDLMKFSMAATSVLGLASLSDEVTVETDPRSADFAKIKVGNTRFDPLGGFQQYIRLFSQILTGETVTLAGKERKLGDPKKYKSDTRWDVILRFFRTKFSPVSAYAADALDGKNIIGEEFNAGKDALESFIPLFVQDVNEAIKEFGAKGVLTGVPAIFGVGVQTYKPRPEKLKKKDYLKDEKDSFLKEKSPKEKWLQD